MYRILAITKVNVSITEYMEINFQYDNTTRKANDIMFQLSIRMRQKVIARNSKQNGEWGIEYRENPSNARGHEYNFPLTAGKAFEIIVLTKKHQFRVIVNQSFFCNFPYRFPLGNIYYLGISGDFDVLELEKRGAI